MFQVLGSNYLSNLIEVIDPRSHSYFPYIHVKKLAVDFCLHVLYVCVF